VEMGWTGTAPGVQLGAISTPAVPPLGAGSSWEETDPAFRPVGSALVELESPVGQPWKGCWQHDLSGVAAGLPG